MLIGDPLTTPLFPDPAVVSEPVALAGVKFPHGAARFEKIPPPPLEDGKLAGDPPLLEPKDAAGANFDIADDLLASDSTPGAVSCFSAFSVFITDFSGSLILILPLELLESFYNNGKTY